MSARKKSECDELMTWLRANLGRGALAPLTGTDSKALRAIVHVLLLYQYTGDICIASTRTRNA